MSSPDFDGVTGMVINKEVVEGRAKPLYIYSERRSDYADWRGDAGTGATSA